MCRNSCYDKEYFPDRGNEERYFPAGERVKVDTKRYPYYLSIPFWTEEDKGGCEHHCHCCHCCQCCPCRRKNCCHDCGCWPCDYWRCSRCGYINYHQVKCSCPECRCSD